jgi:hypothetical protein
MTKGLRREARGKRNILHSRFLMNYMQGTVLLMKKFMGKKLRSTAKRACKRSRAIGPMNGGVTITSLPSTSRILLSNLLVKDHLWLLVKWLTPQASEGVKNSPKSGPGIKQNYGNKLRRLLKNSTGHQRHQQMLVQAQVAVCPRKP